MPKRSNKSSKILENNNNEGICFSVGIMILFIIISVFMIGTIYNFYLTIVGVTGVSNKEIRALCNSTAVNNSSVNKTINYTYKGENPSEIWFYALFSYFFVNTIIFKMCNNIFESQKYKEVAYGQIICNVNCSGIVYGIFCSWGWDQLYNSGTCLEYNFGKFDEVSWGWELMTSAYISFYIQAIFCVFIICFDLSLILVLICELITDCCKNNKSNQIDKDKLEQVITEEPFIDNNIKLLSNL